MKKAAGLIAIVLTATLFFTACEKTVNPSSACIGLKGNTTVELKYGQKKKLCDNDSSCISFTKIVSDSCCPADAVCIWQGTAVIELGTCDPKGGTITLEINKPAEYSLYGEKYLLTLTALNPYPILSQPADVSDYVATVTLKKK